LALLPVWGAHLAHAPVLIFDLFEPLKRPIDGGATLRGRRLLGDNKTWRGALVMIAGVVAATLALWRLPPFRHGLPTELRDADPRTYGLLLGIGTVVGELPNSMLKRQLGIAPGGRRTTPAGLALIAVDQADFVPAVWLTTRPLWRMPARDMAIAVVVVTTVHLGVNAAGYVIGARESPI
jgi:CDP-2,3-bis-(O-geranylgeranyl)-sn-glycerol synthase